MSEITINIIDNSRTISGYVHGSVGEELVASLAAEPASIAELEEAYGRFRRSDSDPDVFGFFYDGFDPEPYDAGILIIDLTARMVAWESSDSQMSHEGVVYLPIENGDRFPLPYRLSDEWEFIRGTEGYEYAADIRRTRLAERDRIDFRSVLFGDPLFEYVIRERDLNAANDDEDLIVNLHAGWLSTPRADLGGFAPRDAVLERHESINMDLHSRALQWSFTKKCPEPIRTDSDAYRYAGFGTNEIVIYYWYVRRLFAFAFAENGCGMDEIRAEAARWLNVPNDDLSGRIPAEVIESERRRINLTVSPHEYLADDDCEICQMLAADFDNPMFWGLDGSSMEYDRYEFSFFATREEFDEDRRKSEEFNIEFNKNYGSSVIWEEEVY